MKEEWEESRAMSRSREGAWIEIAAKVKLTDKQRVAPARERGLKFYQSHYSA